MHQQEVGFILFQSHLMHYPGGHGKGGNPRRADHGIDLLPAEQIHPLRQQDSPHRVRDKGDQSQPHNHGCAKAEHSFEYFFCQHRIRRKRSTAFAKKYGTDHLGYGWAGPKMRWCTERLKNTPRERYLRKLRETYTVIEYVGIAADEGYRMERKNNQNPNHRHPLIDWNITEVECLQYCYDHGFDWGGLYEIFHRVSCWCCPLQSLSELRKLYHHFPELWEQLKKWDSMTWRNFRADYSVIELEKRFDFEEEWQKAGKPLRSKAFYSALKNHLASQTRKEDA